MPLKAKIVPFVFDWEMFARDLKNGCDNAGIERAVLSTLIGIDSSTLSNWITRAYPEASYPTLGHFLAACNWLDNDPRVYFVLAAD